MSHFTVLVIGDDVEAQLAPYDENDTSIRTDKTDEVRQEYEGPLPDYLREKYPDVACWKDHPEYPTLEEFATSWHGYEAEDGRYFSDYNPKSKWDWYQVGGRWSGFFKLKPGVDARKAALDNIGTTDSALKRDIDFEGMQNAAEAEAREQHRKFFEVLRNLPLPPRFKDLLKQHEARGGNVESARKEYWALPSVQKLSKADMLPWGADAMEVFGVSEDEYAKSARDNAVSTYALVKDGIWYEKGQMGWWGMSLNEVSEQEWLAKVNELIEVCPEDTRFTLVDCHI
jgi:hypothetical protein